MLLSFVFWNIGKQPLTDHIVRLSRLHDIDVIILAECADEPALIVAALNNGGGAYHCPRTLSRHIVVITRLPKDAISDDFNDDISRLTIRHMKVGPHPGVILAAAHLVSKINWSSESQAAESSALIRDIIRVEEKHNNFRTILVGDFNMNPFEAGMVGAHAFHGVMTQRQAGKVTRDVQGRPYRYFYNPMWGIFGDRTDGPPGTHYLHSSEPIHYFWNMYDQVLLRPALMENLRSVRILDSDGVSSFLTTNGTPETSTLSDHLPLFFQLSL